MISELVETHLIKLPGHELVDTICIVPCIERIASPWKIDEQGHRHTVRTKAQAHANTSQCAVSHGQRFWLALWRRSKTYLAVVGPELAN